MFRDSEKTRSELRDSERHALFHQRTRINTARRAPAPQLFLLCLGLVLIAGCASATDSAPGTISDPPSLEVSPLDEFRGVLVGTPWHNELLTDDERTRLFDENIIRREELIAQCMLAAGWDYWPQPQNHTFTLPVEGEWRPDDEDWVAQHGFGMFSNLTPPRGQATQWFLADLNMDFIQTLTEDGFLEYQRALHGRRVIDHVRGIELVTTEEWIEIHANPTLENVGCQGWAEAEVARETDELATTGQFAALVNELANWQHSFENTVSEADRDWARCMTVAGYPDFARQADARLFIATQASDIATTWDFETDGPDPTRSPQMDALREQEIAIALADLDCRIAVDFRARQIAHRITAESEFYNDHITEFQALRAAVELGEWAGTNE